MKIITAVVTEPVDLATVKSHLHIDSNTLAGDMATYQSITPGSQSVIANFGLVGTAIDVLGKQALINLDAGTCGTGGSVTAKIQHSDDNITFSDFTGGAFTVVTETNDNAIQEKEYTGGKQYVRVVATVAAAVCSFSASMIVKSGGTVEDSDIAEWITEARQYCESHLGRALATQTLECYLDRFPCEDEIEIPYPPLQSVTSVKYKDSAGAETTMTVNTDYIVDADSNVGRIFLPYSDTWPTATLYPKNPITIKFVAGYNTTNPIPKGIKKAMLVLIGYWYKDRDGNGDLDTLKAVQAYANSKMDAYRVRFF